MQLQDYEREHAQRIRRLGAECTLFLKRNGDFPLKEPGNIALFGSGARMTVKGGTGSGEVNSHYAVNVEQGLENAGFTVTSKYWMETYEALRRAAREQFVRGLLEKARKEHKIAAAEYMGAVMPEPEYSIPLYGEGDTAIYVLARISGEGSDREAIPGDILLTETETRDILALNRQYKRFLLVLNVGGVVDLGPVTEVENILLLSQLGAETGNILADILLGKSFPSGKLSTTWAAWGEYPDVGDFGGRDETRYKEGVFMGYRYFDSVGKKPLFPFGFGLGYTDFEVRSGSLRREGEDIRLLARVRNTGAFPGRETVQLYVSQPGEEIPQPRQVLAAFAKTPELQPGEDCQVTLEFSLRDLAYYDEDDDTWTLEKGSYLLRLGASSADTKPAGKLWLNKSAVSLQCRACCGKPDFTDWSPKTKDKEKTGSRHVLAFRSKKIEKQKVRYGRKESPELLTDKYQPVFAMSDDMYGLRLRKLDDGRYKYDYHGTVIRYGEIRARKTRNSAKKRQWPNLDTMAVFGDGSVKTFVCDAHTPEEYLKMGAVHVMAFGPWLLSGGEINPDVLDPNYYPYNEPRAAIGMVEPYHYVAIAAQGRPDGKYAGVHLDWMAEKMKEMGCTEALNLDGGATVTMFFNGKVILTGQVKTVKKQTVPDLRSQGSLIAFGLPENAPAAEK